MRLLARSNFVNGSGWLLNLRRVFSSERLSLDAKASQEVWKLPRIMLDTHFTIGETVTITADLAHYLANVMRLKEGSPFRAFNSRTGEGGGEYLLKMDRPNQTRRMKNLDVVHASVVSQLREAGACAQLPACLYLAPIRRAKMKLVLEKATELGVAAVGVVQTALVQGGNIDKWDTDAYTRVMTEACEQSERLALPHVPHTEPVPLAQLLLQWQERKDDGEFVQLLMCRERVSVEHGQGIPLLTALLNAPKEALLMHMHEATTLPAQPKPPPFGLLIGPEGGWTNDELDLCTRHSVVKMVSLGDSVLRAETAALAALSIFSSAVDHTKCN
jgi:16S rRNA (uracil1498-N3)-methyltransferase